MPFDSADETRRLLGGPFFRSPGGFFGDRPQWFFGGGFFFVGAGGEWEAADRLRGNKVPVPLRRSEASFIFLSSTLSVPPADGMKAEKWKAKE